MEPEGDQHYEGRRIRSVAESAPGETKVRAFSFEKASRIIGGGFHLSLSSSHFGRRVIHGRCFGSKSIWRCHRFKEVEPLGNKEKIQTA